MEQSVTITFEDSARAPVPGTLAVAALSVSARVVGALKLLALLWLCALAAVFIPILHFVLVPGLLLAGPVFALRRFGRTVQVTARELACPKCKRPVPIEEGATGWPVRLLCPECSARLALRPGEPPRAG